MRDSVKKALFLGGIAGAFAAYWIVQGLTGADSYADKYEGYDLTEDAGGAVRDGTYTRYLNAHADADTPAESMLHAGGSVFLWRGHSGGSHL